MDKTTRWLPICLLVTACGFASTAHARAPQVSGRLAPDTVAPGEAATLSVTVDADAAPPSVPRVNGLDVESIGQQTNMTSINGLARNSVTYLFSVRPTRSGDISIAGIRIAGSTAPTLTLHVVPGTANSSPPTAASASASPLTSWGELAFMRLHVDSRRMYAGQSVPFTVQAYFRGGTGVALKGHPQLSSDAFVVSGLDDTPNQQQTSMNGVPYLAVTWHGALTAVKAGDHPLDMSMPVSLQYRETAPAQAAPPSRRLRDLFGFGANSPLSGIMRDPLFDSMLDQPLFDGMLEPGRLVTRDITLHGRAGQAAVQALPERGKPADFNGAVGQFELGAKLSRSDLVAGEPVDLHVTIRGAGNFDQFKFSGLGAIPGWRSYAAHGAFKASDKLGLHGSSEYVQPVASEHAGDQSLPGVQFSYFDPSTSHYVTKTTPALAVHVAPAASGEASAVADRTPLQLAAADTAPPATADEVSVRSLAQAGVPTWLAPVGLGLSLLALVASALAFGLRSSRWQRLAQRWRVARRLGRERRAMQQAARAGDRLAYLRSARQAIQQRLAADWGVAPESITLHELDLRWPTAPEAIRRLFELADRAEFGGGRFDAAPELADLTTWAKRVDRQITDMEVPS